MDSSTQFRQVLVSPVIKGNMSRSQRLMNMLRVENVTPKTTRAASPLMLRKDSNYLEFSANRKFDPAASPSSSILKESKRKAEEMPESPSMSAKRKRVGFSDPVSTTKEFLISDDENRMCSPMVRCLVYENDEDEEIPSENLKVEKLEVLEVITAPCAVTVEEEDTNSQEISTTSDTETQEDESLVFKDKESLLEYMKNNLTADEIFQKFGENGDEQNQIVCKVVETVPFNQIFTEYLKSNASESKSNPEQMTLISSIVSELSRLMNSNKITKCKVLDQLSRSHQQEFLDQALQANSANSICDKLSTKTLGIYLISNISKELILQLISNTNSMVQDQSEYQEVLSKLFKDIEKVKVFDIVHEFLRQLL